MTSEHWEHFEHGADIGVRGVSQSRAGAFEQAALALTSAVTDLSDIEPREPVHLSCAAPDDELLLVDWLNAIVYEMATRGMLFSRFEVDMADTSLRGTAWGEKVDVEKHQPVVEIKGATYTGLRLRRLPEGEWVAECVVDV